MKQTRFMLLTALLLLVVSFLFTTACDYITGAALNESRPSIPRWVWTVDNSGNTFIIDRNTRQPLRDITPDEAFGIIGTSEQTGIPVIIDVRTPSEYADGHLRDAINIDVNSPAFQEVIGQLDKDKTYIVYCRTARRSANARDIMEELGFRHILNMTGGITDWIAQGFPVVK